MKLFEYAKVGFILGTSRSKLYNKALYENGRNDSDFRNSIICNFNR